MDTLRNIGIFAHVDAGKTTLSEAILLHSGAILQPGSVDSGTAHTDTLPVEQRRGISVKATCVSFKWKDATVNLIDTPGHTDFSSEIERSLWGLDAAILLVDAVEAVQPQTEVLFSMLKKQNIPMLLFINKIDREGADVGNVMAQIKHLLTKDAVLMEDTDSFAEAVCATDDELAEMYLSDDTIEQGRLLSQACSLVASSQLYPVYSGSALRDIGVTQLLDAVVEFLPPPKIVGKELSGVVFSSVQDKVMGRGLLVRLFGGRLENRMALTISEGTDFLTGTQKASTRKITQIRDVNGSDLGYLEAGMVGIVYGLGDLEIGYVFGERSQLPREVKAGMLRVPLITVQVLPESPDGMRALREACQTLSDEDPLLQAKYIRSLDQLHVQVMGTVQLEILGELLRTRFGLNATFSEPTVIYKETIRQAAIGFVDYTMPKPCWAILKFLMEPAPRGSGVTFSSQVPLKNIMACYQHQVEQTIPMALRQGRLGWEVTDIKITLVGGEHHLEHTHPLDFIVATPMAIHDGLNNGGSVLLEPILKAKFLLPQECIGRVISDVNLMRGEVLETESEGDRVTLSALIPVATSLKYSTTLAMLTGGRGTMNVALHSYREAPMDVNCTVPRRSTDPLDKAKYILVIRNAIAGELFDDN